MGQGGHRIIHIAFRELREAFHRHGFGEAFGHVFARPRELVDKRNRRNRIGNPHVILLRHHPRQPHAKHALPRQHRGQIIQGYRTRINARRLAQPQHQIRNHRINQLVIGGIMVAQECGALQETPIVPLAEHGIAHNPAPAEIPHRHRIRPTIPQLNDRVLWVRLHRQPLVQQCERRLDQDRRQSIKPLRRGRPRLRQKLREEILPRERIRRQQGRRRNPLGWHPDDRPKRISIRLRYPHPRQVPRHPKRRRIVAGVGGNPRRAHQLFRALGNHRPRQRRVRNPPNRPGQLKPHTGFDVHTPGFVAHPQRPHAHERLRCYRRGQLPHIIGQCHLLARVHRHHHKPRRTLRRQPVGQSRNLAAKRRNERHSRGARQLFPNRHKPQLNRF